MIMLIVPAAIPSAANLREHWSTRMTRVKIQRKAVRLEWLRAGKPRIPLPAVVTLIRCAPRSLDDDNLVAALKAPRDEVAAIAGIDDRDPRMKFEYRQEKSSAQSLRIVIRRTEA